MPDKTVYVIIPSAGRSVRMGSDIPKILMEIAGVPVIIRTLQAFDRFAEDGILVKAVVVTSSSLIEPIRDLVSQYDVGCVLSVIEGGATRTESVSRGVAALERVCSPEDIVFVHDGARCLVDNDTLTACLDAMDICDVCAAAVPVKSTVKQIEECDKGLPLVVSTPDRSTLMEVQTPQCFHYGIIDRCCRYASENNVTATDDTALAEALGYKVHMCRGSYSNIKITTPEDIKIAEALMCL